MIDYSIDSGESQTRQGGNPRERGGPLRRGLSLINKVTGEMIDTDTHRLRLSRMRRRVKAWADAWGKVYDPNRHRMVMVTLTYKDKDGWRPNHIRDFMRSFRRAIKGKLLAYAWVAELQKRGAVHYHVLLVVARGTKVPLPDKYWRHGMTRIETAKTPWYIVKYTSKGDGDGDYPSGLRVFAVWISVHAVPELIRYNFRLSVLPGWLREIVQSVGEGFPVRRPGGGWLYQGRVFRSPWAVMICS